MENQFKVNDKSGSEIGSLDENRNWPKPCDTASFTNCSQFMNLRAKSKYNNGTPQGSLFFMAFYTLFYTDTVAGEDTVSRQVMLDLELAGTRT